MVNQCPLCKHRVSDWQMATGKAQEIVINGEKQIAHKECLIDYKLRHGKEYADDQGK